MQLPVIWGTETPMCRHCNDFFMGYRWRKLADDYICLFTTIWYIIPRADYMQPDYKVMCVCVCVCVGRDYNVINVPNIFRNSCALAVTKLQCVSNAVTNLTLSLWYIDMKWCLKNAGTRSVIPAYFIIPTVVLLWCSYHGWCLHVLLDLQSCQFRRVVFLPEDRSTRHITLYRDKQCLCLATRQRTVAGG